jgi:drug/metabolite transporter (DMT)-like permease
MPIAHEAFISPPLIVWIAGLFRGVADIAFCLLMMNWVQQFISSTRASLIYSLEPMWAALFGYFLAGEVLSIPAWFGCGCILMGMVVGVLRLPGRKHKHNPFNRVWLIFLRIKHAWRHLRSQ